MASERQKYYPNFEQQQADQQAELRQYADIAAAQEAVARNAEPVIQPQPNLFAQTKSAGYPGFNEVQTGVVSQPVVEKKPAPVVQNTKTNAQQYYKPIDTNSSTAGMDYLNSLYTNPREEERLRKASVMNQRILAIGDALRHIGNIANTVGYAPAQQFNNPVAEEQARYERGKSMRDRANQQYYTYQQQKAAQDAAMMKMELERANAASIASYRQAQTRLAAEKIKLQQDLAQARKAADAARVREIETRIKRIDELLPGEKKLQSARINQANASASNSKALSELNKEKKEHPEKFRSRGGSVGGYTTIRKRNVKNPLTGKYEVVTDTITRTPSHPRSEVDEGYDGDDMDLGLEEEENGIDLGLE